MGRKKAVSLDKQLDDTEKLAKDVANDIEKLTEEEFPPNYDTQNSLNDLKSLEVKIQSEKSRCQNSPNNSGGDNKTIVNSNK